MAQPNLKDAVESAFEAFSIAFRAGRRVFGKARFPRVVIVDAGTHRCGQHCNIIAVSFGIGHTSTGDKSVLFDGDDTTGHTRISRYERKLFVCPDTLMSHKCGVDVCTGEYMVTAEGRVCCLTGSIVGGDASVLSHGWREDVGRTGWEGANAMVGTGEYGTMAERHNEGGDTRPGRRICKQKKANSRWNVSTLELDHCARLVRKMFHGSHERRIYLEESLCTATSKAIVAIDRYVRLARSNNEVIHIGRVGRLFRRYCGKFSNAGSVFPDDVHANTLAMGYCKCAADFLAELLPSRQSVSLPPPSTDCSTPVPATTRGGERITYSRRTGRVTGDVATRSQFDRQIRDGQRCVHNSEEPNPSGPESWPLATDLQTQDHHTDTTNRCSCRARRPRSYK